VNADSPDLEASDHPSEGQATIFVSDPSAEADRLSTALRGKGYTVIDVPLSLLVARVAVQIPALILLDVDAEGALDAAARLHEIPDGQGIDILFLGEPGRTLSDTTDALRQEGSGFLARPVDVEALIRRIQTLVGAHSSRQNPAPGSAPPSARGSSPSSGRNRRTPLPENWSDAPGALSDPEDALEPAFGTGAVPVPRLPLPALSPEIEKLLMGAEERSTHELGPASMLPASEPPSPDEEVDAVLPSEVLAALDEPIDEDDDDLESDAGLSTSIPKKVTTGNAEAITANEPIQGYSGGPEPQTGRVQRPDEAMLAPGATPSQPATPTGDAKQLMETPRPPKRGLGSALPPPMLPRAPLLPRDRGFSSVPPGVHLPSSVAPSTIPPGPGRPSPPPSLASPFARAGTEIPEARSQRTTGPPAGPLVASRAELLPPGDDSPGIRRAERDSGPPTTNREPVGAAPSELPQELGLGDALTAFAICVRERATGALVIDAPEGVRRILLRDGDVVTAASGLDDESLVGFLGTRGDISRDVATRLHGKIPAFGRHAGAALVANGHIGQDQLWPVLRAHAEWVLSCAICAERGAATFEVNPPGRLKAEPSVFGGATGSEVLIEVVRRAVSAGAALGRLGGGAARFFEGPRWELLSECALPENEQQWLNRVKGGALEEALETAPSPDIAAMLYALVQLGVLAIDVAGIEVQTRRPPSGPGLDPLDAQAVRSQVKARLNLVEEGDYFSVLGVARNATSYEIKRAYLELRRGFEPSRILNAATADLADDVDLIIEVLDEAHDILRDHTRRERYRRAIEEKPPA